MKLFTFLDLRYRNLVFECQEAFSLSKDAEAKTIQWIIAMEHRIFKFFAFPKLFVLWTLTNVGLVAEPVMPVMKDGKVPSNKKIQASK